MGTKLVWNSFRSTLSSPAKRRDAVIDDTALAMSRFSTSYDGRLMSRCFWQISYIASLSKSTEISVWSKSQCVVSSALYGSTTHVEIVGDGLEHQSAESGTGSAAHRVVHHKALHIVAVVDHLSQAVVDLIDHLFAHGVMAAREIVGRVLFARE